MKAVARRYSNEEKREMAVAATDIIQLLKDKFPKEPLLQASVLEFAHRAMQDEVGIEKIIIANKEGKDIFNRLVRTRQIVEGMQSSDMNLVLFRDEPEVWMQYYMSMFLKKSTYVIAEQKHKDLLWSRGVHLTSKVFMVPQFNEKYFDKVMKEMEADAKKK